MRIAIFSLFLSLLSFPSRSQPETPFGLVSQQELGMISYPGDSSAGAVVLDERGYAYIDIENHNNLYYDYYAKIKILSKRGLQEANFEVPIYKSDKNKESFVYVQGSTYNSDGTSVKESKMNSQAKYVQNFENYDLIKFALPDVREGSVIEVKYRTTSPFIQNFHPWDFQWDIPKIRSEFTAKIPANFQYNIALRGAFPLKVNTAALSADCYVGFNGAKASCSLLHYEMENIPAFREEDYMTAKKNFISAISYELATIEDFQGHKTRFTETWENVDRLLKSRDDFGKQIKKAQNLFADSVVKLTADLSDPLQKAKKIDRFIKSYFTWDGKYRMLSASGVKNAFEKKAGSSADINLSLAGALQQAGLNAYPVILSTRKNGLAIELYPVITGFNDVVVALDIDGKRYLVDGTSRTLPFGALPMECMNGRGRLIDKESGFIDLKPILKRRQVTEIDLSLGADGHVEGNVKVNSYGYNAVTKRSSITKHDSRKHYLDALQKDWGAASISNYEIQNLEDPDKPFIETANVRIDATGEGDPGTIFLNPFFTTRLNKNPFTSEQRLYPVDYSAPVEIVMILSIAFPENLVVDELPQNVALALPNGGGKYSFSTTALGNKLQIVSNQIMSRAVYSPDEYHYLKELYARIIQIEQSQIVFKRK